MTRASLSSSCYRFLLYALPREVRHRYADDMVQLFGEVHQDAWARGPWAVPGVWWRAVSQTIGGGMRDRFGNGGARRGPQTGKAPRRGSMMLDNLVQDLRFAFRSFVRQPGFAVTAIGILALGIGATTAIFSVVDTIVLRDLPYPEPDRLIYFDDGGHPPPAYGDWLEELPAFESVSAVMPTTRTMLDPRPQQVTVAQVTANVFSIFGVSPARGRLLTAADVREDAPIAVLTYDFWVRQFSGDESVLGRSITLDGVPYQVVGVTAADFALPQTLALGGRMDVWTPLDVTRAEYQSRGFHVLRVVGRLRDGESLESARFQMAVWEQAAADAYPESNVGPDGSILRVPLLPLHEAEIQEVRDSLFMLLGAVGLMLLIACANVANLLLARGTERGRELAVRAALGGSRRRIAMQLLTESLALALSGGLLGLGVAYLGVAGFSVIIPDNVPRFEYVGIDLRVLTFALAAALTTGGMFGLAPAFFASRTDVNAAMKGSTSKASAGGGPMRLNGALVVGEIAIALMLLVGAGLLFNSLVRLTRVDLGFDTDNLLAVPLTFSSRTDADGSDEGTARLQLLQDVIDQVDALPGVESVSAGMAVPFSQTGRCCMMSTARSVSGDDSTRIVLHPVTPGFFATLGVDFLAGRDIVWSDANAAENPIIITQTMTERLFGEQNPVGETISVGRRGSRYTVVGVVNEPKFWSLSNDVDLDVFVPYDTSYAALVSFVHLAVRSRGALEGLQDQIRETVWSLAPAMPIPEIMVLETRISESITSERFLSTLLIVFAVFAILLAGAGIYGTMLYAVSQQSHELGIRMALGADALRIMNQVLTRGGILTSLGITLGIAGAAALSRVLESMLFGVATRDVPTYGAVTLLLAVVAIAACYVPARKAARLDPVVSLRQ